MNESLGLGTTNSSYQLLERMNVRDTLQMSLSAELIENLEHGTPVFELLSLSIPLV